MCVWIDSSGFAGSLNCSGYGVFALPFLMNVPALSREVRGLTESSDRSGFTADSSLGCAAGRATQYAGSSLSCPARSILVRLIRFLAEHFVTEAVFLQPQPQNPVGQSQLRGRLVQVPARVGHGIQNAGPLNFLQPVL